MLDMRDDGMLRMNTARAALATVESDRRQEEEDQGNPV